MSDDEKDLPVTCPTDLRQTGHVLLLDAGDTLNQIFLALYQKRYRREVEVGLFDFTPNQQLVKAAESISDDEDDASIEYEVTDVETARRALENLELAFDYRKKTPAAPGIWVLLVNGLAETNWELFRLYLDEGRQARIYVIAAVKDSITPGLPMDLFQTVIQGAR